MTAGNAHESRDRGYWDELEAVAQGDAFRRAWEAPATGMPRRSFLQLMSASIALAGLAGCRWPRERIVPFGKRPEDYEPGRRRRFATCRELGGVALPLLVTSFDGRPIKVEGNPDHPASGGAADLHAQASILELYDPDRSRTPWRRTATGTRAVTWDEVARLCREELMTDGGSGLAVLAQHTSSPSIHELRRRLLAQAPGARWFEYDAVPTVAHRAERAHLRLAAARVVVDLDADILGAHPDALRHARDFATTRTPGAAMSRLYVFEPGMSTTGAAADHRFAVTAAKVIDVLAAIAADLAGRHQLPIPAVLHNLEIHGDPLHHAAAVRAVADDLWSHRGAGLLAAGPGQGEDVHQLCRALNDALGNTDHTVIHESLPPERRATTGFGDIHALAAELSTGQIDRVRILGCNPAYDAPADLELADELARTPLTVHLGSYCDETASRATWHLPQAHFLESWGDARAYDGTLCAVQPLIAPLHGGRTVAEVLSMLVDAGPRSAHAIARATFESELDDSSRRRPRGARSSPETVTPVGDGDEAAWQAHLRAGFAAGSATCPQRSAVPGRPRIWLPAGTSGDDHALELVLAADRKLYDGRFANNAWLQELPDSLTKLTWDNAALVSPALAHEHRLEHGDVVQLELGGRRLDLPVMIEPGQAVHAVSVPLGYGRTAAGRVGTSVGSSAYALRTMRTMHGGRGLTLQRTGRRAQLACSQDPHRIDALGAAERERRVGALAREGTLEEYRHHPDFAAHRGTHHPELRSMWQERQTDGHRWGMSIDLNRCIGCNACVVACQAENNIPVVGKDQVARGREMHWLRLDRYVHGGHGGLGEPGRRGEPGDGSRTAQNATSTGTASPRIAWQPMACAHCELAPCEQVCPVAATMHSDEGLNVMVYNRCVGTRYCSNNCPYKVRRFNYFNLFEDRSELEKLAMNPDVTVRARGVMEKCTYCVQRIESARISTRNAGRGIHDGDIVPACAQTCPTEAIVFGDLSDPESHLSRRIADSRSYALLGELNIKPRTTYMARIRNPHPELEAAGGDGDGGHGADNGHRGNDGIDRDGDHGARTERG